ncbi:hypothetical protein IFM89_030258 [Coptis chinensis]|uniref:Transcription factor MYC/MYB N-terminal domain-containing protein n=1 Tax=Coptis chinensis TaxID=261450 RepID=A0A835HVQ1_9MAGN|nr:hypothetical protein IFM89_030258 [Coptis chinensis]
MEEHINPLAVTHLLQQTLRSLCIHEDSQWVYAVFWRILPRNYPPPKWDVQGGAYDRSRGNRRNWILVWEDGFCNFAASMASDVESGDYGGSSAYGNCEFQHLKGLQPEVFFKMSHEIYNFGEGLVGKVAADHGHKWIHKEPGEQEINFLSAWNNTVDSHPRTWEAQFQSGIKVVEDLSYIVLLRKKFHYLESIPGVLLPHPSSSAYPFRTDAPETWPFHPNLAPQPPPMEFYNHFNQQPIKITPSMSSLEALLSKLPSVVPTTSSSGYCEPTQQFLSSQRPLELMGMGNVAKEEIDNEYGHERDMGDSSSSMSLYHQQQHYNINVNNCRPNKGF